MEWSVQDAKARFSAMLETCLVDGAQIVTKRGARTAVLVPLAEWDRLTASSRPSLKTLLLSSDPSLDLTIPKRGGFTRRTP